MSGGTAETTSGERAEIEAILPHRSPFLFADRILVREERRLVTEWTADPASDFYRGHYPGKPITPGVILCECVFQAGALLMAGLIGKTGELRGTPVVTRIQSVRFRSPVLPGEVLQAEAELVESLAGAYFMKGGIRRAGRSVMTLEFACTLVPEAAAT